MSKTIKQVATELNVSKPTITKAIELCGLSDSLVRVGNRFELTDEQVQLIKSQISQKTEKSKNEDPSKMKKTQNENHFKAPKTKNSESETLKSQILQTKSQDSIIAILHEQIGMLQQQLATKDEQLSAKDEQLAAKDKQLNDLTAALVSAQDQHKALTDALTAAQALHAGTIQERLVVAEQQNAEEVSVSVNEASAEHEKIKRGFFSRFFRK